MVRVPYQHIFTERDRQKMLVDIARVALAIGQDLYPEALLVDSDIEEPLAIGGALQKEENISPRERIAYLAATWRQMENALRRIEAMPDTALAQEARPVRLEKARRATSKDLLFALTRLRTGDKGDRRVVEYVPMPTTDTPANRLIKMLLAVLLRDVTAAAELAAVVGAPTVVNEALQLRTRLRRALRRAPWRTLPLTLGNTLPPLPQSVRSNGAYRLLYDIYRRYREGFRFDWQNPLFTLPPREMWLLYEYWCFFQISTHLRAAGFRTVHAEDFAISRSGLTFTLVKGRASVLTFVRRTDERVTLTYNRHFPAYNATKKDEWYTRSHAMRPDIVLERNGRLLVLDAKFKTYGESIPTAEEENLPLTADINQCHAYRDGIRHQGKPCVAAAWLLYPGRVTGGNRPVIAYGDDASPWSEVGAMLMRPFKDTNLSGLINEFLSLATEHHVLSAERQTGERRF